MKPTSVKVNGVEVDGADITITVNGMTIAGDSGLTSINYTDVPPARWGRGHGFTWAWDDRVGNRHERRRRAAMNRRAK